MSRLRNFKCVKFNILSISDLESEPVFKGSLNITMPVIPPQLLQWLAIHSLLKYESWQGTYFSVRLWGDFKYTHTHTKTLSIGRYYLPLHDFSPIDLNFDFQGHTNKLPLPCCSRSFVLWWKESRTRRQHVWGHLQFHQVQPWNIRQVATLCLHFFIYRLRVMMHTYSPFPGYTATVKIKWNSIWKLFLKYKMLSK